MPNHVTYWFAFIYLISYFFPFKALMSKSKNNIIIVWCNLTSWSHPPTPFPPNKKETFDLKGMDVV